MKIGYKGTYDYKCLNQLYEVGKIYEIYGKPILCEKGFHYCKNGSDVLNYYKYKPNFKLLEIEDLSDDSINDYDKTVTNKIKIIKEIVDLNEINSILGIEIKYINDEVHVNYMDEFYIYKKLNNIYNLIYESFYDGFEAIYSYDERNNLINSKYNGRSFSYSYDDRNNLIYKKSNEGYWEKIEYDLSNNIVFFENSDGQKVDIRKI